MSMQIPTSSSKVTKQVQYYAEINGYGAQVVNPTFINAGVITNVGISIAADHEEIRIQGSRKQYADILMGIDGTITIDYRFLDTKLLRYAITDPNGAGTIEESLAFIFSRKIDDVEEFCLARGCIAEEASVDFDRVPTCSQSFYASSISEWLTLAQLKTALGIVGGDPVTFAGAITAEPWTHLTGSTDEASTSITTNGNPTDITKMTVTVNNNLLKEKPLGYKNVKYVEAGNKVVTVSIEPFLYDNTFFLLMNNYTLFNIVGCLNATSTPVVNLTVTGVHLNSYDDTSDASGGDFITTPSGGSAIDAQVTVYPA
jgi:hypothetical protein